MTNVSLIPRYTKALQQEIEKRSGPRQKIDTIYFGGGTPSLLPVKEIAMLLNTMADHFSISRDAEITFEVNPGTIPPHYLKQLKTLGINRISIGVQSFDDEKLRFLTRIHTAGQAVKTINDAETAGFDNVSLDFMYGLPFETRDMWAKELKQAVKMPQTHMSCYMLTIEPGTALDEKRQKGLITCPGAQAMSAMFKKTAMVLTDNQYDHYEVSNFSKGRKNRSRHNSKYWDMVPYHGFGAAAHSYDGRTRSWNHRNMDRYIRDLESGRLPVEDREMLSPNQQMLEMILLRLRTSEGLDLAKFQAVFHQDFENRYASILEPIFKASLGFIKDHWFVLTLDGKTRLDGIVEAFAEKIL